MPRGRFPSGTVVTTARVAASMTVRSPDCSFVTYAPSAGGVGFGTGVSTGFGGGASFRLHPDSATIVAAITSARLIGYPPARPKHIKDSTHSLYMPNAAGLLM